MVILSVTNHQENAVDAANGGSLAGLVDLAIIVLVKNEETCFSMDSVSNTLIAVALNLFTLAIS